MSADDRDPALPAEEPTPTPADPTPADSTTTDQAPEPAPEPTLDTEATPAATDPTPGALAAALVPDDEPPPADGAAASPGPVGWLPPDGDATELPPPPGRGLLLAAWIVGGIGLGLAAWLTYVIAIGGDAYRAGVFVGAVVGPLILVALIRFFLVKLHVVRGRVLRSPWIPLGAGLLAVVLAVSRIGLAAPLAPVDPATGLHVAAPFQIVATDPQVVSNMEAALGDNEAIRSSVIRSVVGQDGSTSILFIADGEFRDADLDEVASGMGENAGAEPTVETIDGHKVVIASLPNGSLATWITEPLVYTVVAADRPTLDQVVAAVIAGE